MFDVDYYRKRDGAEPTREHIDGLPMKLREKVFRSILALKLKGNLLRYPDTDSLGDGIFVLRTIFGNDTNRVFFLFTDGRKIILTHGFIKKTQKTPRREIDRAKAYREDYFEQKRESEHNDII
jgi:phage-related protein